MVGGRAGGWHWTMRLGGQVLEDKRGKREEKKEQGKLTEQEAEIRL